jgi:hypothetical protein
MILFISAHYTQYGVKLENKYLGQLEIHLSSERPHPERRLAPNIAHLQFAFILGLRK